MNKNDQKFIVEKIRSEYITKKVADRLTGMCKTDRESYEKYWDDINPFIKFGCIKDTKFADKVADYVLFKNLEGKYLTLKDFIEENKKEDAEEVVEAISDAWRKNLLLMVMTRN